MARVLGMRLLRVDGVVLLAPGRLEDAEPPVTPATPVGPVSPIGTDGATASAPSVATRTGAPGAALARAYTLLQECEQRRDAPR